MAESKITKNEYRKLLWENSHSGSWKSTDGDIILSSGDYDYLEIEMRITGGITTEYVQKISKPTSDFIITIQAVETSVITDNFIMGRKFTYVSNTRFTPSTGIIARWSASSISTSDTFAVPTKIYGIKY